MANGVITPSQDYVKNIDDRVSSLESINEFNNYTLTAGSSVSVALDTRSLYMLFHCSGLGVLNEYVYVGNNAVSTIQDIITRTANITVTYSGVIITVTNNTSYTATIAVKKIAVAH